MDDNLLAELRQPFLPSQITWQVVQISQDQNKAQAQATVGLRDYLNRLDDVCGLAWSVTYTPWADAHRARLICHLTLQGVTRSSTGEPDSQLVQSERSGSVEAQAFKQACALFGLGRDLDRLPSPWVEYDPVTQQFTAAAQAYLANLLGQPVQPVIAEEQPESEGKVEPEVKPEPEAKPELEVKLDSTPINDRQPVAPAIPESAQANHADTALAALRTVFDEAGQALYGEQWDQVSKHNIERITGGQGQLVSDLTEEQLQKLIDGMRQLKRRRQAKQAEAGATPS